MRLRRKPVIKDRVIEKSGGGGIAAKMAGHRPVGSVRSPIHFVEDFAEIYEIVIFLA